jgi:hypothetical protein
VFGQLVLDESAREFLQRVATLPMYAVDRPAPLTTTAQRSRRAWSTRQPKPFSTLNATFSVVLPKVWVFPGSKNFMREIARRVEATQVGVLLYRRPVPVNGPDGNESAMMDGHVLRNQGNCSCRTALDDSDQRFLDGMSRYINRLQTSARLCNDSSRFRP